MDSAELVALRETTATLLAHAESTHILVKEVKEELKQQSNTIIEIRLQQAKSEERLQNGSKTMQAIRDERAACEERCKDAAEKVVVNAAKLVEEAKKEAAKELAITTKNSIKKTDILSGMWQLVLASGLGGAVVAAIVKLL